MTVSQWAERYRILSAESSAEPGRWSNERAPYQPGIMDAITDPHIHTVVFMKSAQVGWTDMLNNCAGYFMHQDPCPMLLVQPTLQMGQAYSKDRLAPMLRDTPVLHGLVKDARSKDSENTVLHKKFPGGHLTISGANSPASLAMRPVRIALVDEPDRYPLSAGAEGNPLILISKRQTTFWNRKMLIGSTPTVRGVSIIEREYEQSDKRIYLVPCPHCNTKQRLMWAQLEWPTGEPKKAQYRCVACEELIPHSRKRWMLKRGEWKAQAEFNGIAGFHISELYSPWSTWAQMAEDFLAAKDDTDSLKAFTNTSLGETWEEYGEEVDPAPLMKRRETYDSTIPEQVLVLTLAVDVQDNRLEYEVKGWSHGEESYGIEAGVLWGDTTQTTVWTSLDDLINKSYQHPLGAVLHIACTMIDSGGHSTQAVYDFCLPRSDRRVYAIKGVGGVGTPIVTYSPKRASKGSTRKVDLYLIGVDECKRIVTSRFKKKEPGPGYYHFPMQYPEEYFLQCAAEKCVTKYRRGFAREEWVKIRARNEAFDLNVYHYAAVKLLNPVFESLENRIKNEQKPVKYDENEQKRPPIARKRPRKSWAKGWK